MTYTFTRFLNHDLNEPVNDGGFHEVILDKYLPVPQPGDTVEIGDSDLRLRGRVRCLVAIVEVES